MSNTTPRPRPISEEVLDKTLRPIYYGVSRSGGFQGAAALHAAVQKKFGKGAASLARVRDWVRSQKVGSYLQATPPRVRYARFTETVPNRLHQADTMFLPHDRVKGTTYKYVLTVIDTASRYKAARAMAKKDAATVALALADIYGGKGPLKWPEQMMVDAGTEFKGPATKLLEKNGVAIRRADKGHHRSQAFVESFNKVLAERLFRIMYGREFETGEESVAWVGDLQAVVRDLNNTETRLIKMRPVDAIKLDHVPDVRAEQQPTPPLDVGMLVRVAKNEAAKSVDEKRRATDPYWTAKTHAIVRRIDKPGQESLYYFSPAAGLGKHGYTRSQLRPA